MQPYFLPDFNFIENITNANPGVVTTDEPHRYNDGLFVRIAMNGNFGMNQVSNKIFPIKVIDSTSFSIGIDTTNFDAFVNPTNLLGQVTQDAISVPVSEIASSLASSVKNALTPISGT